MGYTVLARTLRPRLFDDLVGQSSIVQILKNTISEKRIAHAYLFSGPRGVGKTSSARILARAVNCLNAVDNPCNTCLNCKTSLENSGIDVIEIDGASNNSVDDIRDLRETVKYAPSQAKYKVYIIDEAHMLSASAFNALLKTLEEPPPHVIFILATTAPSKILTTVLSRCQHLSFKRISAKDIEERLISITKNENIKITKEALRLISRAADGSMRDSLTLLDQICSYSNDIAESDVRTMLGMGDDAPLTIMTEAIINGNRKEILKIIEGLYESGVELKSFISELVKYIRDVLVSKITQDHNIICSYSEQKIDCIKELIASNSEETLTILLNELINAEALVRTAISQRTALEMSLVKISFISVIRPINEIMDEIRGVLPNKTIIEKTELPQVNKIKEIEKSSPFFSAGAEVCPQSEPFAPLLNDIKDPELHETETENPETIQIGLDNIEKLWKQVLKRLETTDQILSLKLSDVKCEVDDNGLNIIFAQSNIHFDSVFKQKKSIQVIIKELTGKELNISIIKNKELMPHPKEMEQNVRTIRNKNMDEAYSDPLVIDALDLFDGRIVEIKTKPVR